MIADRIRQYLPDQFTEVLQGTQQGVEGEFAAMKKSAVMDRNMGDGPILDAVPCETSEYDQVIVLEAMVHDKAGRWSTTRLVEYWLRAKTLPNESLEA